MDATANDGVDRILEQWARVRPDLDASPIAVIGRLSRTARAVEARLERNYRRFGLDSAAFDVLATLYRSGAPHRLTAAALADNSMITSSAVAQRVNRLVESGFVTRERNPDDARSTLVALTDAGRVALERCLPAHLELERELLAALSPADRDSLIAALRGLHGSATSAVE